MWRIRREQIEALDAAVRARFVLRVARLLDQLSEGAPVRWGARAPELVAAARSLGIETERGIARYAMLACLADDPAETHAAELLLVLRDMNQPPAERLATVEARLGALSSTSPAA